MHSGTLWGDESIWEAEWNHVSCLHVVKSFQSLILVVIIPVNTVSVQRRTIFNIYIYIYIKTTLITETLQSVFVKITLELILFWLIYTLFNVDLFGFSVSTLSSLCFSCASHASSASAAVSRGLCSQKQIWMLVHRIRLSSKASCSLAALSLRSA